MVMLLENKKKRSNKKDSGYENLKLTKSEIETYSSFKDLDDGEAEELIEFVFQLSMVLFKSHANGKT